MTNDRFTAVLIAAGAAVCAAAAGAETIAGPVPAAVVRVIDGDTLEVRARVWLGTEIITLVRLRGVDAPERNGACPAERRLAVRARRFVVDRVAGAPVRLHRVGLGKYAGRVIADVVMADGVDLGTALAAAGLVRPYRGGRRIDWCRSP